MGYDVDHIVKDKLERDANGFFICPFCSRTFRGLAYHTTQVHKINGRQLRRMFNLPYNYSLQVEDLKALRRKRALEYDMDKQLELAGKKTQFSRGHRDTAEIRLAKSIGHKKIKNFREVLL